MSDSEKLDRILALLEARPAVSAGATTSAAKGGRPAAVPGLIADDYLLNGKYGNPSVYKDFDDWKGEPMQGKPFSQCSLEWLDMAADVYDRIGGGMQRKGNDKFWRPYQNGSLCRRWAQEIRAGRVAPPKAADVVDDMEGIPF